METEQQEDRVSVSLAWKEFFGTFYNSSLIAVAVCTRNIRISVTSVTSVISVTVTIIQ